MSRLTTRSGWTISLRRKPRSYVEITRVVRATFNQWHVTVEYTYGRMTWEERVAFTRTPITRKLDAIVVKDLDFPADRELKIAVPHGTDMATTITNVLIAGRW